MDSAPKTLGGTTLALEVPDVSYVTPVYANEATLGETLRCIAAQITDRIYLLAAGGGVPAVRGPDGEAIEADVGDHVQPVGHARDVEPALNRTLSALGVEKLDMYLNHWPWPNVHTPGAAGDHRNPNAVPPPRPPEPGGVATPTVQQG